MNSKRVLLLLAIAAAVSGPVHAQRDAFNRPGVGPANPNRLNQDLETRQQILLMDERRRAQEQKGSQEAIARFLKAIKARKGRFPDFDKVVTHGASAVTPTMLGLMAESQYAADIAYYLGKHPDQSLQIAQMQPADAGAALHQIESQIVAGDAARK